MAIKFGSVWCMVYERNQTIKWHMISEIPDTGGGIEAGNVAFIKKNIFVPYLHKYKLIKFWDSGAITLSMK